MVIALQLSLVTILGHVILTLKVLIPSGSSFPGGNGDDPVALFLNNQIDRFLNIFRKSNSYQVHFQEILTMIRGHIGFQIGFGNLVEKIVMLMEPYV